MSELAKSGLYDKYEVKKRNEETDINADYFVLRIDNDPHARVAAKCYAESIKQENRVLAFDILSKVLKYEGGIMGKSYESDEIEPEHGDPT
jgi:hypothetical protein